MLPPGGCFPKEIQTPAPPSGFLPLTTGHAHSRLPGHCRPLESKQGTRATPHSGRSPPAPCSALCWGPTHMKSESPFLLPGALPSNLGAKDTSKVTLPAYGIYEGLPCRLISLFTLTLRSLSVLPERATPASHGWVFPVCTWLLNTETISPTDGVAGITMR